MHVGGTYVGAERNDCVVTFMRIVFFFFRSFRFGVSQREIRWNDPHTESLRLRLRREERVRFHYVPSCINVWLICAREIYKLWHFCVEICAQHAIRYSLFVWRTDGRMGSHRVANLFSESWAHRFRKARFDWTFAWAWPNNQTKVVLWKARESLQFFFYIW